MFWDDSNSKDSSTMYYYKVLIKPVQLLSFVLAQHPLYRNANGAFSKKQRCYEFRASCKILFEVVKMVVDVGQVLPYSERMKETCPAFFDMLDILLVDSEEDTKPSLLKSPSKSNSTNPGMDYTRKEDEAHHKITFTNVAYAIGVLSFLILNRKVTNNHGIYRSQNWEGFMTIPKNIQPPYSWNSMQEYKFKIEPWMDPETKTFDLSKPIGLSLREILTMLMTGYKSYDDKAFLGTQENEDDQFCDVLWKRLNKLIKEKFGASTKSFGEDMCEERVLGNELKKEITRMLQKGNTLSLKGEEEENKLKMFEEYFYKPGELPKPSECEDVKDLIEKLRNLKKKEAARLYLIESALHDVRKFDNISFIQQTRDFYKENTLLVLGGQRSQRLRTQKKNMAALAKRDDCVGASLIPVQHINDFVADEYRSSKSSTLEDEGRNWTDEVHGSKWRSWRIMSNITMDLNTHNPSANYLPYELNKRVTKKDGGFGSFLCNIYFKDDIAMMPSALKIIYGCHVYYTGLLTSISECNEEEYLNVSSSATLSEEDVKGIRENAKTYSELFKKLSSNVAKIISTRNRKKEDPEKLTSIERLDPFFEPSKEITMQEADERVNECISLRDALIANLNLMNYYKREGNDSAMAEAAYLTFAYHSAIIHPILMDVCKEVLGLLQDKFEPLKMFFNIIFPHDESIFESIVINNRIKIPRIGSVSKYTKELWKESHQLDYASGSFNVGSSIQERMDIGIVAANLDDFFVPPSKKRKNPPGKGSSSPKFTKRRAGNKRQKTTNSEGE